MKRYVNDKYLAHVRGKGCLVCGGYAQAHHLKVAYQAGMGKKVHDYYTVPLCYQHHDDLHRLGDERTWWDLQGIDPLEWARKEWSRYAEREGLKEEAPKDFGSPRQEI